MCVRASTEPAASGGPLGVALDELDPVGEARRPRRGAAPPASISGLWSTPTTRHGYRRASAMATAAVPVATSATTAPSRVGGRRDRLDHEVVPAPVLAEREQLRPAVVVARRCRRTGCGRALSVGDRRHAQYASHTCRASARPGGARPRRGRPGGAVASCRRRGGAARPGGLRDDARLRGRAVPARPAPQPARASRPTCSSCPCPTRGRSRASSARRWRRWDRPDAVLRLVWTPGAGGDGSTGFVLVTPLPDGLDAMRARGIELASLQLAIGATTRSESAVAPGGREVDELRRQHGRPGRGPQARRRRRASALARGDRARVPDVEHLVRRGRRCCTRRPSSSASWRG